MSLRHRNTNVAIQQRFAPIGTLAIQPQAFGMMFHGMMQQELEPIDGVAIINIRGPLMQHCEWFFDSYEDIKGRVVEALGTKARAIVLAVDSPGGVVSGCFDVAREIRAICAAANVPVYSHISGTGCSAAYALATAAQHITVSQSAIVGSIGVLHTLLDLTQQNQMFGATIKLIASGVRKPDGNPNQPITDDAVKASQDTVNELAEMFFALCAEHGWSNVDAIRSLEAASFTGDKAVSLGLASAIGSLDSVIALAKVGPQSSGENGNKKGNENMATPMEDAKASLRKMADDGTDEEKKSAKAALAALDGDGDSDDSEEDKDKKDKEAKAAKAEADDKEAKAKAEADEKKDKEAKASDSNSVALRALAEVHEMKAERVKEKEDSERATLIASRPDFSDDMVALLSKEPIDTVRKWCKDLKRGPNVRRGAAKATQGSVDALGVQGAQTSHGGNASRLPTDQKAQLDAAMGITTQNNLGVRQEANKIVFGVSTTPTEGR